MVTKNWDNVLKDEYNKDYFKRLRSFLKKNILQKFVILKKRKFLMHLSILIMRM